MSKKFLLIMIVSMFLFVNFAGLTTTSFRLTLNNPPDIPEKPSGPEFGLEQGEYMFITITTDPEGHKVKYGWDFDGDLELDWWTDYYRSGKTHKIITRWEETGWYDIRVKAEDRLGAQSDFSPPHTIFIDDGSTLPLTPSINGPLNGKIGEEYEYTFCSSDPNGYDLYYKIEWGDGTVEGEDGWIGAYPSSTNVMLNHTWTSRDTYYIYATAKNINGYIGGTKSLPVKITKSREKTLQTSLQKFFESNLRLSQIFSYLLRLISN